MKTLITALTTASLLLVTGPALADRDDRHHDNRDKWKVQQKQEHHNRVRDIENRRKDAQNREKDRRNAREAARKNAWDNRRDDRREQRQDNRRDDRREQRQDRRRDDRRSNHRDWDRKYTQHHRPHRPHHKPVRIAHKHRWRPSRYHYGHRWHRLPKTYVSLSFGGLGYYFSDGIFYRPHGPGYVVAQAPVGAFVQALPGTAVSLSYNGLNYFVAYDTYYRWDHHRRGYLVVANPGFL